MTTMTPEERYEQIQRQLEFLAASQAQHDARMAEISQKTAENAAQIAENSRLISENAKQISDNSRQIGRNAGQVSQLADFVLRLGRVVEEGFKHTDERLNALIHVVERYFSNGRQ